MIGFMLLAALWLGFGAVWPGLPAGVVLTCGFGAAVMTGVATWLACKTS